MNLIALLPEIKALHQKMPLTGYPKNALLNLPDNQLAYLLALLKDELPTLPNLSIAEWENYLSALTSHGILPLLYWKIKQLPENLRPPAEILQKMQQFFLLSGCRALQAEAVIKEISPDFSKHKIPFLVLKGSAWAHVLYPDPALRPFSDLDILVTKSQFPAARTLLKKLGYRCHKNVFEPLQELEVEEVFCHTDFPKKSFAIDLHWGLYIFPEMLKAAQVEKLLEESLPVKTKFSDFAILNFGDALLHATAHLFAIHNQELRLIWICDISRLAEKITTLKQWPQVIQKSLAQGSRLALENALKIATLWTALRLPKEVADFARWPKVSPKDHAAWHNVLTRHKQLDRWFAARWPRGLSWLKNIQLLYNLAANRLSRKISTRHKPNELQAKKH
jgi:hypothetical protein